MSSFNVRLPLRGDTDDGYTMIKDLKTMVVQNFKMLLLTNPGERVMIPQYGAGIKRYLFELDRIDLQNDVRNKITEQVGLFMPYVRVEEISFGNASPTALQISIRYSVPSLNIRDLFTLEL